MFNYKLLNINIVIISLFVYLFFFLETSNQHISLSYEKSLNGITNTAAQSIENSGSNKFLIL